MGGLGTVDSDAFGKERTWGNRSIPHEPSFNISKFKLDTSLKIFKTIESILHDFQTKILYAHTNMY